MRRTVLPILAILPLAAAALAKSGSPFALTVHDEKGAAVAGAQVAWSEPADPSFSWTGTTDAKGVAKGDLPGFAHPYRLTVTKPGFRTYGADVDFAAHRIRAGQAAELSIALQVDRGPDPVELYNDAIRALRAGDDATTRAKLEAAVAAKPDFPEAWNVLAILADRQQRWADGLAAADRVLALDPKSTLALRSRYDALAGLGDARADAALDALAAGDPSKEVAKVLYNAGVRRYHAGDREGALARWTAAIGRDPDLESARFALAQDLAELKRYPEALAANEELLAKNPKHLNALKLQVDLCRALGDPKKLATAEAALANAQGNGPKNP